MADVATEDEKTPIQAVEPKTVSKGKRSRIMIFMSVSLILIFMTAFAGGYFVYRKNLPAFQIGPTKITKKQYNNLIDEAAKAKVSKNDATNTIIAIEKKKLAAKQLNITVSDHDIALAATQKYGVYESNNLNDWQKLNGTGQAIDNKLLLTSKGGLEAAVYYFPFSRLFAQTIPPSKDPKFGDRTAVADDKTYALSQAKSYREKLTNGSINPKDALTQIHADARLDYGFAANDSNVYATDASGKIYLQGQTVSQQLDTKVTQTINALKAGETSDINTIQAGITLSPLPEYKGQTVDVAYYFVQLDTESQANPTLQKQFDAALNTIKVTRHV